MEFVITLLAAFAFGAMAKKKGREGLRWGAGLAMVLFGGSAAIGWYAQAVRLSGGAIDPMASWYWLLIVCAGAAIYLYHVDNTITRPASLPSSQITLESRDTKSCPFCAEAINTAAIVCKHCKRDLPKN